jgi:CTP synthase
MEEWLDYQSNVVEKRTEFSHKGGTMRLGAYPCILKEGTKSSAAYNVKQISERHRHRYEINYKYQDLFTENGMVASGQSPDGKLIEIIELESHPWFVGVQFHPELKSSPMDPHPLFSGFVNASLEKRGRRTGQ